MVTPPTSITTLANERTFVFVQQSIVILLAGGMLDGGALFQVCVYAFAAFWGGVVILSYRRKKPYTRMDILLFRWGSLPLCIISFFLTRWIWHLRGY